MSPSPNNYLPRNLSDAMNSVEKERWKKAVDDEVKALFDNKTCKIVRTPVDHKVLHSRFVFLKKFNENGSLERHKARLIVKGYEQTNVRHVYAPVVEFNIIRVAIACLMTSGGGIHQLDVKTAFLNARLQGGECIYIHPPAGLNLGSKEGQVLKLNKALYGLKEALRILNRTLDAALKSRGFRKLRSDNCVYIYDVDKRPVWILVYVEDVLVMAKRNVDALDLKGLLMTTFKMRDLGLAKNFLGVHVHQDDTAMFLSQKTYMESILRRFGMEESKSALTPLIV